MADAGQLRVPIAKAFPLEQLVDGAPAGRRGARARQGRRHPPMTALEPPVDDADVPRYWRELGLPGLVDVHVHFLPDPVQAKVWQYFARGRDALRRRLAGRATRCPVDERLAVLERLGVRAFPTLPYPHKPGMAAWLNEWSAEFAQRRPAGAAVGHLLSRSPRRPATSPRRSTAVPGCSRCTCRSAGSTRATRCSTPVWARLEETGTPVVIHCGSGPLAGEHTGPEPVTGLLERYPRLQLVIAHLGHAGVPGVPRPGRAVRAGAPGHHDVRHRLHRAADAVRPAPTGRGWPALRDKVLLGSDFPSIPYPYAHQLAGAAPAGAGGGVAARRPVGERCPAVRTGGADPELHADRRRAGHPRPARPGPLLPAAARLAAAATTTDEWATLRPADGSTGLSFQLETDHVPPVWPPEPGDAADAAAPRPRGRRPGRGVGGRRGGRRRAHRRARGRRRDRARLPRPGRPPLLPVRPR